MTPELLQTWGLNMLVQHNANWAVLVFTVSSQVTTVLWRHSKFFVIYETLNNNEENKRKVLPVQARN